MRIVSSVLCICILALGVSCATKGGLQRFEAPVSNNLQPDVQTKDESAKVATIDENQADEHKASVVVVPLDVPIVNGLAYDDVYKMWNIENYKGSSIVLYVSSLTNYRKNLLTPHIQGLLLDQGFRLIDPDFSESVLEILEEQAKPQYADTSKSLGEWVPVDLVAFVDIKMKERYKSIDGPEGVNYWVAESITLKLVDVKKNTIVSSMTVFNAESTEQMAETDFLGAIIRLIRHLVNG